MKKILVMIMAAVALCSCEHEDISYITDEYRIGNILCSDGSIVHPAFYNPSHKAVGVIFWVNKGKADVTDKAYAVSVENIGEYFLAPDTLCSDVQNVSSDKTAFDGFQNTVGWQTFMLEQETEFSSIKKVVEYSPYGKKGWFIGSIAQELKLFESRQTVNQTLELINGEQIEGDCWSSTEGEGEQTAALYALSINYNSGNITHVMKTQKLNIRPIISIDKK